MNRLYQRTRILMGAPFEITAFGKEAVCGKAIESAFQEAARIERCFTIYQSKSPLSRLNRSAKKGVVPLDEEILEMLSKAVDYADQSGGAFDPTAGRLIDLWGFGPGGEITTPPTKEAISSALQSVGYRSLKVHSKNGQLERLKDGLSINLGGIAKGYAIDRAVRVLKEHKIGRGLVSCGSTLYGFGRPEWQILIQHPRNNEAEIETVALSDCALATSGDYERCFFYKGKRYSHLIDPRTGYPVSEMASVSVIAKTAMAADVLSTTAFVLKSEKGKRYLENQSGVEGFIVSEAGQGRLKHDSTDGWEAFSVSHRITRRGFLMTASVILLGLILPGGLISPDESEGAYRVATEKEALNRMFPDAGDFEPDEIKMTGDVLFQAQKLTGRRFRRTNYKAWIAKTGDETVGYAIKLNVIGKKRPITFLVGSSKAGQIIGVEVLIYRESKGSEIRYSRFMRQFYNKTTEDPLRLWQDIRPISGATLSSRSTAYAVRKALSIFKAVYQN